MYRWKWEKRPLCIMLGVPKSNYIAYPRHQEEEVTPSKQKNTQNNKYKIAENSAVSCPKEVRLTFKRDNSIISNKKQGLKHLLHLITSKSTLNHVNYQAILGFQGTP